MTSFGCKRRPVAKAPAEHYAVMRLSDGQFIYQGLSLSQACARLDPGTCYGKGRTEDAATCACHVERARYLSRQTTKTKD